VIEIQAAPLDAVQAHPGPAATSTLPVSAPAPTLALVAESPKEQPGAACATRKDFPAIASEPTREAPALAVADQETVPAPLPLAPDVTESHEGSWVAAVQAQPWGAAMSTDPEPAAEESEALSGERTNTHGAPTWDTVNADPAIVRAALRPMDERFAPYANTTFPGPDPALPEVIVTQLAGLVAVQAQPGCVRTTATPWPATSPTEIPLRASA
jgi:hypothetical protein